MISKKIVGSLALSNSFRNNPSNLWLILLFKFKTSISYFYLVFLCKYLTVVFFILQMSTQRNTRSTGTHLLPPLTPISLKEINLKSAHMKLHSRKPQNPVAHRPAGHLAPVVAEKRSPEHPRSKKRLHLNVRKENN